ncbi:SHOCT domain-containing protein, partial [Streptomyces sp. NPDC051172]|uniref:SHOCT domain-containing protein n=1 Tax=Streptomyces sp. NPDC051172 TaxID=3155796 RepID=UPI00341A3070
MVTKSPDGRIGRTELSDIANLGDVAAFRGALVGGTAYAAGRRAAAAQQHEADQQAAIELTRLGELRDRGVLTDAEFAAVKSRLPAMCWPTGSGARPGRRRADGGGGGAGEQARPRHRHHHPSPQ